jgi:2-polyprenyl-3-methyl-5-hydroxy-6-metoxy-1,4-benzoquinol methylase
MPLLDVATRRRQPELIDQPDLDPGQHKHALQGLERINWWSGSARILWPSVRALARWRPKPLRLLDLATGAGDVPLRLWTKARRAGLDIRIDGCDRSAQAVEHARKRAAEWHAPVHFFEHDAFQPLPAGYDILTCSLFLHHLDDEQAVQLLRRMGEAAHQLVLVNDLARSRAGFLLAYVGTRILSRSPVVWVDGPRSVEAAFTLNEAREHARQAGLEGTTVVARWPCRYLLAWQRQGASPHG